MARRIVSVAPDRRVDPASPRTGTAADEGDVTALDLPPAHELLQPLVRLVRARDNEEARSVPVEPVHDPRPVLLAARSLPGQPVDERAARVARSGVHDDPGRLVDDEQVLVLVGNAERHVLRFDRRRRGLGRLELDLLPALEAMALGTQLSVDSHDTSGQEALSGRARADLGKLGQEAVEPCAGRRVRNADRECQERTAAGAPAEEAEARQVGRGRRGR